MICKNCKTELLTKYQKVFCSLSCTSQYASNNRKSFLCENCNKEIKGHQHHHKLNCKPYNLICDFGCGKSSVYFFKNGKACCSKNTKQCSAIKLKCSKPKKTKEEIDTIKLTNEQNRRIKLSNIAKKRKLGGYIQGSGRGKKGWYKGYWCDSSYELAWIIYQLDHNISFTRNTKKFQYSFENKKLYWIPDFILHDGTYIEIKGYETEQSKAKINNFPHKIILLKEKDLSYIFEYVIEKYSKNFIQMYE